MKPYPPPWRKVVPRLSCQRGQALSEFLIIAAALIPLFLLVPIIAKYQDIAHATQIASRYVAFDALVRNTVENSAKPDAQLQDEVRRRFFSNSNAPIKTNDVAGDFKAHQNLFWRTPDDKPLIAQFSDITVSRAKQNTADRSSVFFPGYGATGIQTADVSVKLANLPAGLKFYEPFDKINLSMTRSSAILYDSWSGKNPQDVQGKFSYQVPITYLTSELQALTKNPATEIGWQILEPGNPMPLLGELGFWSDVVPSNRLGPAQ